MLLLTLGASGFLSSAVVRTALERGHDVVAVSRGRRGHVPDGARHVVADRDDVESLRDALGDVAPDAVVDTCGYDVVGARAAAGVLAGVPRYVYVSSISAYRDWPPGPVPDESAPTFPPDADLTDYGPMKAESERVLEAAMPGRVLSARAGLIIGPGDRTRRLTAWLHRVATQERVVVPESSPDVAFVDVRDLAGWLVDAAEEGWSGPVNATGPVGMTTYRGLVEACRAAVAASGRTAATLVPVPDADLVTAEVRPWVDLPFWLPPDVAATAWQVGTHRARELGLPSRPIEETLADTWAWLQDGGADLDHPEPAEVLGRLAERAG